MSLDGAEQHISRAKEDFKIVLRRLVQLGFTIDEFLTMIEDEFKRDKRERLSIP